MYTISKVINDLRLKKDNNKLNLLSPIILNDEQGIVNYFKILKKAIDDKDARNIAISGSYGSGKSSILKSFLKKNPQISNKTIIISTSSFLNSSNKQQHINKNIKNGIENQEDETIEKQLETIDDNENKELSTTEEEIVEKLEKTIVKQIVYRTKYNHSKFSNINRPKKFWRIQYIILSIMISFIIFSSISMFTNSALINKIIENSILNEIVENSIIQFLSISLFIVSLLIIVFLIMFNLLCLINKFEMKLKYNDVELEISKLNQNNSFSFLDNLYEIIYFFISNKCNILVFEDIDRYGPDICMKLIEDLKELNLILNECSDLKKRNITFIYSFKDSIFYKGIERTKFYDYIISVLPISSSSNSYINFVNELNKAKLSVSIDLIKLVSKYIIDMRMIKSIVNDFVIFSKVLKCKDLDKLFAMIVFKNYNYKDYDNLFDLTKNNKIDEVMKKRDNDINIEFDSKINQLNNQIENYNDNYIKNQRDIKELLIYNNRINGSVPTKIYTNNKYYELEYFYNSTFDIELLNDRSLLYINGSNYNINYDKFKDLDSFKNIIKALNQDIDKLVLEKNKFEEEKINNAKRKELAHIMISNCKEKELIEELIYNDYIDNNYLDYITSVSNDNNITANDSRFIKSLNQKQFNFDLDLTINDDFLKLIREDLNGEYILNISLINALINLGRREELNDIIKQFDNMGKVHIEFLNFIKINYKEFYILFIELLSKNFEFIWNSYSNKNINTTDDKLNKEIWIDFLHCKPIKTELLSNREELNKIVSIYGNIYNIAYDNNENIHRNILFLNIRFNDIEDFLDSSFRNGMYSYAFNKYNKTTYEFISIKEYLIENDLYIVNEKNIKYILEEPIINFGIIFKSKYNKNIINNMKKHMEETADNLYIDKPVLIKNEVVIEFILSNSSYDKLINKIIKEEDFKTSSISINKKYIPKLIEYNHVLLTWDFITEYIKHRELEEIMVNETINNIDLLIYSNDTKKISKINSKTVQTIIKSLYKKNKLQATKLLLNNYDTKKLSKINVNRKTTGEALEQLVDYNLVSYTKNNKKLIGQKCDRKHNYLYQKNYYKNSTITKYKDIISKDDLLLCRDFISSNDLIEILTNWSNKGIYNHETIELIIKEIFDLNEEYSINYKVKYINKLFDLYMNSFEYVIQNKQILFKIKK